ncbi:MAG: hypothetical protein ACP5M7_08655 [Thermoproteota archaeon]
MSEWRWIENTSDWLTEDEIVYPTEVYICKKNGQVKFPKDCESCPFFKRFAWYKGRYVVVCGWKHGQS